MARDVTYAAGLFIVKAKMEREQMIFSIFAKIQ